MFRCACVMLPYILLGFQSIISEAYHIPVVRRKDSDLNEPTVIKPVKPVTHPSAKGKITLFHGTSDWEAANKMKTEGFDLDRYGAPAGDFHSSGAKAGYLTDSIYSAAQFVCYPPNYDKLFINTKRVYVVEFIWEGDKDTPIHEFSNDLKWKQFWNYNQRDHGGYGREMKPADFDEIMAKTMITGPMDIHDDVNFTPNFWQYAVIGHRNRNLKYTYSDKLQPVRDIEVHKALCRNVPKGKLSDEKYAEGQKSNPKFEETLVTIQKI
ncbi:hypothetical protein BDP27DRAFT_1451174 [Rhodocollybia butyracea]|uniref:Uncharacterized protein n=1 Tax=Rhodocollybia butyracea TaxID=206335 RepID=A0A9P5PEA7_9AGAR|nr:hypothetical protein BDP27DRAFT_1451174 [Rhodocollybia butyracea]